VTRFTTMVGFRKDSGLFLFWIPAFARMTKEKPSDLLEGFSMVAQYNSILTYFTQNS
jgi:hypothetical protein